MRKEIDFLRLRYIPVSHISLSPSLTLSPDPQRNLICRLIVFIVSTSPNSERGALWAHVFGVLICIYRPKPTESIITSVRRVHINLYYVCLRTHAQTQFAHNFTQWDNNICISLRRTSQHTHTRTQTRSHTRTHAHFPTIEMCIFEGKLFLHSPEFAQQVRQSNWITPHRVSRKTRKLQISKL